MSYFMWEHLEEIKYPTVEETLLQAENEPILFPEKEVITEEWVKLSQIYKYIFSLFFVDQTGLYKLDERIGEMEILPVFDDDKSYFEKYDCMELNYFTLRCCARVERLEEDEKKMLLEAIEAADEDSWKKAYVVVSATFKKIMTVNPEAPETFFEPLKTIRGDYIVKGNEIPVSMSSAADFDFDGSFADENAEKKRVDLFFNIKNQIDPMLSEDLNCPTRTVLEVYR